jgi:GNAT superfamily N-acetyltransferase
LKPTLNDLLLLSQSEIDQAVEVLARAFLEDPMNIHFFPEYEMRKRFLPRFFQFRLRQGLRYGEVYAPSPKIEGVAIWRHSETKADSFWRMVRVGGLGLIRMVGWNRGSRMLSVARFGSNLRETHCVKPYMHLGPLGVDPEYQGQGYASKLIRPMLERLDSEGLPSYLEANDESNVPIYEHLGFTVVVEKDVPDSDVKLWLMVKEPSG